MAEQRPNQVRSTLVASAKEAIHDIIAWAGSVVKHGIAIVGGAVMTVLLFVSEHRRGEAYSWRSAEWIIFCALLIAFFLSWRESYRALSRTRYDLALAQVPAPKWNFSAIIISIQLLGKTGWHLSPEIAIFGALHLRLNNLGADSITLDWRVTANSKLGTEIPISIIGLGVEPFEVDFENGFTITYREEHCIYIRARDVVKSGSSIDGILICYFTGLTESDEIDIDTLKVTFNDVAGSEWSTDPWSPQSPQTMPLYYNPGLPDVERKPKASN